MNEFIIYTVKLTRYLMGKGFTFIRTIPDPLKPQFKNWVYEDTPALR